MDRKENDNLSIGGTAGAGAGTFLIFIAKLFIKENNQIQDAIIYLAPTVSLGITAITMWIFRKIKNGISYIDIKQQIKDARSNLESIRNYYSKADKNKQAISEHIKLLEAYVFELEKSYFEAIKHNVKATVGEICKK